MSATLKNPCSEKEVSSMFDEISGRYDFLNTLLSANQDKRWRRHLIASLPSVKEGVFVDVATGTGDVLIACQKASKGYTSFTGVDISPLMLKEARKKLEKENLQAKLIQMSAENFTFEDNSIDCLTISFGLRNVNDRDKALRHFYRSLRKGGELFILEFFLPRKKILSTFFMFYFRYILPHIGGLFSSKKAYNYLPKSLESFYSSKEICEKLTTLGMLEVKRKSFIFGSCELIGFKKINFSHEIKVSFDN